MTVERRGWHRTNLYHLHFVEPFSEVVSAVTSSSGSEVVSAVTPRFSEVTPEDSEVTPEDSEVQTHEGFSPLSDHVDPTKYISDHVARARRARENREEKHNDGDYEVPVAVNDLVRQTGFGGGAKIEPERDARHCGKPSPKRQGNAFTPGLSEDERNASERTLAAIKEGDLYRSFMRETTAEKNKMTTYPENDKRPVAIKDLVRQNDGDGNDGSDDHEVDVALKDLIEPVRRTGFSGSAEDESRRIARRCAVPGARRCVTEWLDYALASNEPDPIQYAIRRGTNTWGTR